MHFHLDDQKHGVLFFNDDTDRCFGSLDLDLFFFFFGLQYNEMEILTARQVTGIVLDLNGGQEGNRDRKRQKETVVTEMHCNSVKSRVVHVLILASYGPQ